MDIDPVAWLDLPVARGLAALDAGPVHRQDCFGATCIVHTRHADATLRGNHRQTVNLGHGVQDGDVAGDGQCQHLLTLTGAVRDYVKRLAVVREHVRAGRTHRKAAATGDAAGLRSAAARSRAALRVPVATYGDAAGMRTA